jgi:hypothetical protein
MPAFWWMYNMYALARNSWKFRSRDKRKLKLQHIEMQSFAPDTVEEIFHGERDAVARLGRPREEDARRHTREMSRFRHSRV